MKVELNFSRLFFPSLFILSFLFSGLIGYPAPAYAITVNELEPNDTNATTNPLVWGQSGLGVIAAGVEYDGWILQSVRSGDLLFAMLSSIIDDGDPILSGYYTKSIDSTTNADMYNDDGGPPSSAFRDSLFAGEPLRRTGALFLRTDGFGNSTLNPCFAIINLSSSTLTSKNSSGFGGGPSNTLPFSSNQPL